MAQLSVELEEEPRWACSNFSKINGLKDLLKDLAVSYMRDVRLKDTPKNEKNMRNGFRQQERIYLHR